MHSTATAGGFSTTEEMLAEAETAQQLTEANLAEHVSIQMNDSHFEECHIRQEGFQLFDRAFCCSIYECNSERSVGSDGESIDVDVGIESVVRQCGSTRASSATVMHRFAFVSPQTEPFKMDATSALNSCRIDEGSLESINLRADAARTVAVLDTPSESDSTKAVTSDTSSDSDRDYVEAVEADIDNNDGYDEPEDNGPSIRNAVVRCPAQGRDRRKRIPRIRREVDETADKRRRVEQSYQA